VLKRLQNLGIKKVYSGVQNKLKVLEDLVAYEGLDLSGVLYMGDDINDYACLRSVHISACPADAATEIKALAQYISPIAGGAGCVRDIIERVMRLQGKWQILE
jgi:3-deoxy-D-manno-octulosonate 8-phosphate phosphatase (KDO 8-P phosphatase)